MITKLVRVGKQLSRMLELLDNCLLINNSIIYRELNYAELLYLKSPVLLDIHTSTLVVLGRGDVCFWNLDGLRYQRIPFFPKDICKSRMYRGQGTFKL